MKAYFECCFLLLTWFARVLSSKISAHRGDKVLLFQNVDIARKEIALYVNGLKKYANPITWTIKNGTITPHRRENFTKIDMDSDNNIWIFNVDKSDEGKYSILNSTYSEVELYILAEIPLKVSIVDGEILSRPVGSDATITCFVSGSGTISIVWIGPRGQKLINSEKYTVTLTNTGNSVFIRVLSKADYGLYTCQAADRFGSTAQDYIKLSEYVPLSVSIDGGNSTSGVSGGYITVTCSVLGTGTITVTWIGPLGNIISNGPKYTMSSYNYNTEKISLIIKSLNTSDGGSYTCQASDSNTTKMEDSISLTIAVLTAVISEKTPLFASVEENVAMHCTLTGSYHSINWYLGNTLLSNGQKYQIRQSTSGGSTLLSLTIFNVQYTDTAQYLCQAVSSIDGTTVVSDSIILSVQERSHLESEILKILLPSIIVPIVVTGIILTVLLCKFCKRREHQQESRLLEVNSLMRFKETYV